MAKSAATRWWACLPALWMLAGLAAADVYTWVDARGNVNVSNLTPPAGARVTAVAHEDPASIARAEASRKAAQDDEVRALSDRIADLERAAAASARPGPPPGYYASAPPPPAFAPPPEYTVTMMPSTNEDTAPPGYGCAWVGCALPFGPGLYGIPVVVVSNAFNRRGRMQHHPHALMPAPRPPGGAPMATRIARRG